MRGRFRSPVVGASEGGSLLRLVHGVVRFRHDEGRMRADKGKMREPRCAALLLAQPADEFAGQESRRRLVAGVDRRRVADAIVVPAYRSVDVGKTRAGIDAALGKPGQPGALVFGKQPAHAEARQHAFVAGEPRIARRQRARIERNIGVAEQRGVVAEGAHGERQIAVTGIERRAVAADPVVHLVEAGIEAGARRRTGRGPGIVAAKEHGLGSQRVDIGGLHHGMAGRRQAIAAPLVAGDEEYVRSCVGQDPGPLAS